MRACGTLETGFPRMLSAARPLGCCLLLLSLLLPDAFASPQSGELAAKSKAGNDAMAAGRFAEAISIYTELAQALPNDAGILMNLGMAQSMAGRPRDAVKPLERAVKLQPTLHPAWLFLGTAYLEMGDAASAVRSLTKAVATDSRSLKARQMLAEAYLSLERYEDAGRELVKLTEIDPTSATAWYGLGQSHEARARVAFDRLRQAAPGSPYESLLTADVLVSQQQYEEALALYRSALEKRPGMRTAHEAVAEVYEEEGHADRAAAERQTIKGLPAPDCVRNKAECEFRAGRYKEAVAALAERKDAEAQYWRARAHNELAVEAFSRLEQLPPSPESHAFRAQLYRSQGRHLESVTELRKAAQLTPSDRGIQRELATSLYLSRDYEAAEPLLHDLLKQESASAELSFMYGDTLLQAQKVEQAIPFLEAAVRRDKVFVDARVSLARAYLHVGRPADAIPHLKAVLETDEDGSLHYQLARAYQATGQPDLAKEMLAKYGAIERMRRK
jgi:tetratricopeptide (TPR) repeat protein